MQKHNGIIQEVMKAKLKTQTNIFTPTPIPLPNSHTIPIRTHVFQTFNNCGPATLSMALSYVNIDKSQAELGQILRPYQIAGGDNDDKSVTLEEIANQAKKYGLYAYLRPNGTIEKLRSFISHNIPVVTRTWLKTNEDIGHYRIIRGYDDVTLQIIQDDSLQNKNLRYSYTEYLQLWQPFNYEYLVIVNEEKKELVEKILEDEIDEKKAWKNALERINQEIKIQPDNWHLTFAKSRIYYYLGEYKNSVREYEKVESKLSFRTLWYQIEPILAYYHLGNYEKSLFLINKILNNQNKAFSELYILRGDIYKKTGNKEAAVSDYQKAVFYNKNLEEAQQRLNLYI